MTPRQNTFSTTPTELAKVLWTELLGLRTFCGRDGGSSFLAMDGAAVVLPRALRAWVRTSLYVRPTRFPALEAVMDGFMVMPMIEASKTGEVFITVTGGLHAVGREHIEVMPSGAILSNSGHFNDEIDIDALKEMSSSSRELRPFVEEYTMKDGRLIYLLGPWTLGQPVRSRRPSFCCDGHELR
ncbi:MAG: hypothetical protein CM1200mP22_20160 [Dehalococcoidia bacterium]|nr:MAG: hypothetical protein CM1200mP22_20160 [Dehalococcoidia bacterium]